MLTSEARAWQNGEVKECVLLRPLTGRFKSSGLRLRHLTLDANPREEALNSCGFPNENEPRYLGCYKRSIFLRAVNAFVSARRSTGGLLRLRAKRNGNAFHLVE